MPTAKRLVDGYKQTFKGIMDYVKWIKNNVYVRDWLPNLFLRRYYSRNAHQLQNWLVQGSGADLLLIKLDELSEYLKDKPHWRLLITVHDEVGFVCDGAPRDQLIKEVNEIKDLMGFQFSAVDIISDVELTTTSWGCKDDWDESLIKD